MVYIRHKGKLYRGKTPESIVRRVWGRTAMIRIGLQVSYDEPNLFHADVVKRSRQINVVDVLAAVLVNTSPDQKG